MGAITGLISSAVRAAGRFDEERCGGPLARPPCVCSFHSKCQTAARVRSFSRRDCVRGLRSRRSAREITSRMVPKSLPSDSIRGWCPVFGRGSCATKKGGEAPKDACHPFRTVPPRGEGVWKRSIADKLAQSAQLICLRGPLAFRRSAAALAPASERQDSAQAALHAKHDAKALPPLRIALKQGTLRAGRNAGGA